METRPGLATSEFWLVVISNALINLGAVDVGGAKYRGLFAILSVLGYALSRGLAKQGVPNVAQIPEGLPGRTVGVKAEGFEPEA